MIKKCLGCGALLQCENNGMEGYVKVENFENSTLCERCFRIQHYNDYQVISKSNREFYKLLEKIDQSQDLVVLVVDLFQIPKDLDLLAHLLTNDVLLVLTKRDLLSYDIYDQKFFDYMTRYPFSYVDQVIISSEKNYHFDLLMGKIKKYQKSKNVYVVGYTNAGKSTMINKIIRHYSSLDRMITTSNLPSTTLDFISVEINDKLTIIDTPGILEDHSMIALADQALLKRIVPKKTIKPRTYQIKKEQTFIIKDLLQFSVLMNGSLTFFINNTLDIQRYYREVSPVAGMVKHVIDVPCNSDVVITGFGFIKFKEQNKIILYTLDGVNVYVRDALI